MMLLPNKMGARSPDVGLTDLDPAEVALPDGLGSNRHQVLRPTAWLEFGLAAAMLALPAFSGTGLRAVALALDQSGTQHHEAVADLAALEDAHSSSSAVSVSVEAGSYPAAISSQSFGSLAPRVFATPARCLATAWGPFLASRKSRALISTAEAIRARSVARRAALSFDTPAFERPSSSRRASWIISRPAMLSLLTSASARIGPACWRTKFCAARWSAHSRSCFLRCAS